ncbi:uncharacterized protein ARMOST_19714 [Armillaria ostoyae]|uniref:Uncharacterized protein n=1 Tax=Armillaria ostoyae TaxID=47428 RepID=A0A284S5A0_ARMOS|nr:uncharacterized protein ARMOST_19714 [Armillaria ostoyae]
MILPSVTPHELTVSCDIHTISIPPTLPPPRFTTLPLAIVSYTLQLSRVVEMMLLAFPAKKNQPPTSTVAPTGSVVSPPTFLRVLETVAQSGSPSDCPIVAAFPYFMFFFFIFFHPDFLYTTHVVVLAPQYDIIYILELFGTRADVQLERKSHSPKSYQTLTHHSTLNQPKYVPNGQPIFWLDRWPRLGMLKTPVTGCRTIAFINQTGHIRCDGVDECNASNELLVVLAEGFGPKLPFMRLIVASRPVQRIATAFKGESHIYTLHLDTSSKDVDRDIQFYLELQFVAVDDKAFQEECKALRAIKKLAARASGLFIWAATVAKFVHVFPGTSRLEALLATNIPSDATEALTTLYRTTLDTLVSEIKGANADIKKYVCNVLGAVLVAETPTGMTEEVLDSLVLDKGSPPSHHIVSMLGSSFDDFLQDRTRCGDEWFVDVTLHRQEIAKQCLAASKSFLQKWSPTVNMDDDVDIPEYICRYALFGALWHINAFDESGLELLASFFRCCFLPWLDVLLCIKSRRVLSSLSLVLNWSNQFGNTESRTLFHHAYLFAYRALQDGGRSYSGPSYIYTHAMSLSPSSNIIRKAWEQLNVLDSPPVSPDKEQLLAHIILDDSEIRCIFFPDSNSIMTLQSTSSLMITQREIDTAQQRSSPEICPSSIFGGHSTFIVNRSVIQFECKLTTPPSPSEWIILPLHDDVSQETIDDPSWLYMGVFSSRTRTFKMYTLLLSHFSSSDFSISLYNNGIVLALKTGFFMKISIDQEDNFTMMDIDPGISKTRYFSRWINNCAAVFGPLHANRQPIGV